MYVKELRKLGRKQIVQWILLFMCETQNTSSLNHRVFKSVEPENYGSLNHRAFNLGNPKYQFLGQWGLSPRLLYNGLCPFPSSLQVLHNNNNIIQIFSNNFQFLKLKYIFSNIYIYINRLHKNGSATRSLILILTDLILLHKTCEIWNSNPSSFTWTSPSKRFR